jgi:secretion/DNA translocation related TadE-like protein
MSAALGSERGAGSILVLTVIGLAVAVTAAALVVAGAALHVRRAGAASDLAALAAADAASGRIPGIPCPVAQEVASANDATVERCAVDGTSVTVTVSLPYLGLRASSSARAGPPGHAGPPGRAGPPARAAADPGDSRGRAGLSGSVEHRLQIAVAHGTGAFGPRTFGGELTLEP